MMNFTRFFLINLALSLSLACEKESDPIMDSSNYEVLNSIDPIVKGDRIFGINISSGESGFFSSYEQATKAGIEIVEINMPWSVIELSEGVYQDPDGTFQATQFYADEGIKVGISLAAINTVKWDIPEYLENVEVSSESFSNAFNNLLNFVMQALPMDLDIEYLSIGNEVDFVLESEDDWSAYTMFYQRTSAYAKANYPELKIGVKTTVMEGVLGQDKDKIIALNQFSDVIMLNYYPQNHNFEVLEPDVVHAHFNELTSIFTEKEIWLTEIGYQSGNNYCKSSEEKQAHFYHNMFEAWDNHDDRIKLIVVDWLTEQSDELLEEWKSYYGDDKGLNEYLGSLGLINYDGSGKAAWKQILEDTEARGW